VTAGLVVAPLAAAHDRQAFSYGAPSLDRYLQTQATQDVRRHVANCFVASSVAPPRVRSVFGPTRAAVSAGGDREEPGGERRLFAAS
jgi:hypothetical protein